MKDHNQTNNKVNLFEVRMIPPKGSRVNEILELKPFKLKVGNINEVKDVNITMKDVNPIRIHEDDSVNAMLRDWVTVNNKQ